MNINSYDRSNRLKIIFFLPAADRANTIPPINIVLEFAAHDLGGLIADKQILFSPGELKSISKQLLEGIYFLHSNKASFIFISIITIFSIPIQMQFFQPRLQIIHRDIKPNNVLVTKHGIIKIADFGLSRALRATNPTYTTTVVTLWYRAPEILLGCENYGPPADVWSYGCVIAELYAR